MLFCSITNLIVLLLLGFFLSPVFIFLFAKLNCAQAIFYRFLLFSSREREKKRDRKESFIWFFLVFIQTIIHFLCSSDHTCRIFFTVCCPFKLRDSLLFFIFKYAKAANFKHQFFTRTATEAIALHSTNISDESKTFGCKEWSWSKIFHTHTHIQSYIWKINENRIVVSCIETNVHYTNSISTDV